MFAGLPRARAAALLAAGDGTGNGSPAVVAAGLAGWALRARVGVEERV